MKSCSIPRLKIEVFWTRFKYSFLFLSFLSGLCVYEGLIIRWCIIGCGSFSVRLWFPPRFHFRHAYLTHCLSSSFKRGTAGEGWSNAQGHWCNWASVLAFSGPFFGSFPSFALKLTFDPFSFLTPFSWQWCSVGRNHGQLICEEWCRVGSKKSQVALLGERKNRSAGERGSRENAELFSWSFSATLKETICLLE